MRTNLIVKPHYTYVGRGFIRSLFTLIWEASFELIGDGSRGMPLKLGLATALMENATDYGSTQIQYHIAGQNWECRDREFQGLDS
jgi:hypothetical protein